MTYDSVSNIAGAYGMHELLSAYSGNYVRIRRSSDSTEQDFGDDGSGNLDVAAIATFLGGSDGFITTWYDQSGNGYNATQTTAGDQPQYIASGINSLPSLLFAASGLFDGDYLLVNALAAEFSGDDLPQSIIMVLELASNDTERIPVGFGSSASSNPVFDIRYQSAGAGGKIVSLRRASSGGAVVAIGDTDVSAVGVPHFVATVFTGTATSFYLNGVSDGGGSLDVGLMVINVGAIGARMLSNSPAVKWDGYISELVLADVAWDTTNRQAAETAANQYWSIVGDPAISVADSVTVSEGASVAVSDPQIIIAESIAVAESASIVVSDLQAGVTDVVSVAESVVIDTGDLQLVVADSITVADFASLSLLSFIVIAEIISVIEDHLVWTVQFARPVSDIEVGNWESTASTLSEVLDEAVIDDQDYIYITAAQENQWWLLSDPGREVDWSGPAFTTGHESDNWPNATTTGNIAAGGITIAGRQGWKSWVNGVCDKIVYSVNQVGSGNPTLRFGLARKTQPGSVTANYDIIEVESAFQPAGTGKFTYTLSSPWTVKAGDLLLCWIYGNTTDCRLSASSTANSRFEAGDVLDDAAHDFGTNLTIHADFCLRGQAPKVALVGDSWCGEGASGSDYATWGEGKNSLTVDQWIGDETSWPNYWMEQYQADLITVNFSDGGTVLGATASSHAPLALQCRPEYMIVHNSDSAAGDVRAGGWDHLDTIKALCDAADPVCQMFLVDLPPSLNSANYRNLIFIHWRTWCARNGVPYIQIWEDMRSGGAMKAEYRHANYPSDTAHCNYVGSQRQAVLINSALAVWTAIQDYGFNFTHIAGNTVASTTFTHDADGVVAVDVVLPTAGGNKIAIDFRTQDANNKWTVNLFGDGSATLVEMVAGSPTTRDTAAASSVVDGNTIEIVFNAEDIYIFADGVLLMNYTPATNFQTEVDGEVDTVDAGGAVAELTLFEYVWSDIS